MHTGTIPVQLQMSMIYRVTFLQIVVTGSCDFVAQCTLVRINHCTYHLFY